ncbi:MAG: outer membrane protein transport protein [Deltaproteobacteria bacterium]|nr:outer membrane protein transport protein [Deltaproteobacteria bacterium]
MGPRTSLLTLLALAGLLAPSALRAGGFEIGDQGARALGRGGAFTVRADDLTAIAYNPAGLARLRGTRFYLGNRFGHASEEYRRAATLDWSGATHGVPAYLTFGPVRNAEAWQLLNPFIAAGSDFGLEDWSFALGVYAPAGIGRQSFPEDGPQRWMLSERETQILYYDVSVAWKLRDVFGVGLSLQWVDVPRIRMALTVDGNVSPGLVYADGGTFDIRARLQGSDHVGFSGILGAWYRPLPELEIAASGRFLPVWVDAESRLSLEPVHLALDQPIALSRDGEPARDVTFSMVLPPTARLGLRYVHRRGSVEWFDLELDAAWEGTSMVDAYRVRGRGLVADVLGERIPIDRITIPKRWRDTWSLRLGGDVTVVPGWLSLRAGGFWESPAAAPAYSHIDFFSGHRLGAAAGFSATFYGVELAAAYSWVFQMPVVVDEADSKVSQQAPGSPCTAPYDSTTLCDPHYPGRPAAAANAGTYLSDYHFVSVSLSYSF